MNLVKWTRKNTSKILVFVIVFAMLAFVVGQFGLQMLFGLLGGGNNQLIASYDDGGKIKAQDYRNAQNELTVLRMLMADQLLMAQARTGFSGPLLVHLLFPDSLSGEIPSMMKQAIQQGQVRITMDQLDDYFQQQRRDPEILWILLKSEAYRAGIIQSNDSAAQTLRTVIPQMTNNQLDAEALVSNIISNNNISQDQILRIYADLLSVMAYGGSVMDNQAVTINQVKGAIGRSIERIDADYAAISAESFIDPNSEVSEAQIQEQFEAYKTVAPNIPTQDNPFGFGYKLGKQIQLEYMLVKTDDVKEQIEQPASEDLEDFYSSNITRFQTMVPSDPNNPDSDKVRKTQTFPEAESRIRRALETEKTETLANILFNEIKDKTEAVFETVNVDQATAAQLQKVAADFESIAQTLSEKHQIPIITGKTGWLNAEMLAGDKILRSLGMRRGQNSLGLTDVVLNATEEKPQRQKIGIPAVRTWETIGPLKGGFYSQDDSKYYSVMAVVRVVGIQESRVAESLDIEFTTQGASLNTEKPQEEKSFSLKETVRQDLLLVEAMDTASQRAEELSALVSEKDWDDGLAAYNDKYAPAEPNEINPDAIQLSTLKQQFRMPQSGIEMTKRFIQDNPAMATSLNQRLAGYLLTNKLYELLPSDAESTEEIHTVVPFEPQKKCLVAKQVKRQTATLKDYMEGKANTALQLASSQSVGLALDHFNSENILKRMNFESKLENKTPDAEQQTPTQDQDGETE